MLPTNKKKLIGTILETPWLNGKMLENNNNKENISGSLPSPGKTLEKPHGTY
jgi:hypothetical protein